MGINSSLEINEIELNPEGTDAGKEWMELYSKDSINFSDFYLINGDGLKYFSNFSFSGYFTIEFESQWLDNYNETLTLMMGKEIVQKVGPLNDKENSAKSWSLCNNSWTFGPSSKDFSNICILSIPHLSGEIPKISEINLSGKNEKFTYKNSKVIWISSLFALLCILVIFLLIKRNIRNF